MTVKTETKRKSKAFKMESRTPSTTLVSPSTVARDRITFPLASTGGNDIGKAKITAVSYPEPRTSDESPSNKRMACPQTSNKLPLNERDASFDQRFDRGPHPSSMYSQATFRTNLIHPKEIKMPQVRNTANNKSKCNAMKLGETTRMDNAVTTTQRNHGPPITTMKPIVVPLLMEKDKTIQGKTAQPEDPRSSFQRRAARSGNWFGRSSLRILVILMSFRSPTAIPTTTPTASPVTSSPTYFPTIWQGPSSSPTDTCEWMSSENAGPCNSGDYCYLFTMSSSTDPDSWLCSPQYSIYTRVYKHSNITECKTICGRSPDCDGFNWDGSQCSFLSDISDYDPNESSDISCHWITYRANPVKIGLPPSPPVPAPPASAEGCDYWRISYPKNPAPGTEAQSITIPFGVCVDAQQILAIIDDAADLWTIGEGVFDSGPTNKDHVHDTLNSRGKWVKTFVNKQCWGYAYGQPHDAVDMEQDNYARNYVEHTYVYQTLSDCQCNDADRNVKSSPADRQILDSIVKREIHCARGDCHPDSAVNHLIPAHNITTYQSTTFSGDFSVLSEHGPSSPITQHCDAFKSALFPNWNPNRDNPHCGATYCPAHVVVTCLSVEITSGQTVFIWEMNSQDEEGINDISDWVTTIRKDQEVVGGIIIGSNTIPNVIVGTTIPSTPPRNVVYRESMFTLDTDGLTRRLLQSPLAMESLCAVFMKVLLPEDTMIPAEVVVHCDSVQYDGNKATVFWEMTSRNVHALSTVDACVSGNIGISTNVQLGVETRAATLVLTVELSALPTTASPTLSPTTSPTGSPTTSPTTASPTEPPTSSPTGSPTTDSSTTSSPITPPTVSPTTRSPTTSSTTTSPTGSPTTGSPTTSSTTISPTGSSTTSERDDSPVTSTKSTEAPHSSTEPHGLSTKKKIGLASGVVLLASIVGFVPWLCSRIQRRRQNQAVNQTDIEMGFDESTEEEENQEADAQSLMENSERIGTRREHKVEEVRRDDRSYNEDWSDDGSHASEWSDDGSYDHQRNQWMSFDE